MTHFAKIENDIVIQVIVAEQEHIDTLQGEWIQTSYNTKKGQHTQGGTPLRGNYAGIGYEYDRVNDLFLVPKPYPSFKLNIETATYEAPKDIPLDNQLFTWNKTLNQWDVSKSQGVNKKMNIGKRGNV